MPTIPIMRPRLPCANRLLPYLKQIDAARVYTNFGPLARRFDERLAEHFGPSCAAMTTANATLGLALALAVQEPRPGTLCAIPGWTFVASAHAAWMAGLVPYFVDVSAETEALDLGTIADAIRRAPGTVGAVMPVVPFGCPIDMGAWDDFRRTSGLAVVIDAAAGFDSLAPGSTPAVVSLHATKVIGVGEGGVVVCHDTSIVQALQIRANFGFDRRREAMVPSTNAKLSEYHAAVGLAALDEWPEAREEWMTAAQTYRKALGGTSRARLQRGFGERWVTSTCLMNLGEPGALRAEAALTTADIDSRRWWGDGAHAHAATAACPRAALPVTEALARTTIGLPLYRDMTADDIHRVVECVLTAFP